MIIITNIKVINDELSNKALNICRTENLYKHALFIGCEVKLTYKHSLIHIHTHILLLSPQNAKFYIKKRSLNTMYTAY